MPSPARRARRAWTPDMERQLTQLYAAHSAKECAQAIGVTVAAIHNRVHLLGLSKSPEWISERTRQRWAEGRHDGSRAQHFRKGQAPVNKGRPQSEWMPASSIKRTTATRFKAGRAPEDSRNYRPIGSLRVSRDGYLERKVTDDHPVPARRWVGVHRLVWEAAHGPVPDGHVIRFKDGRKRLDPEVITTALLECITQAENMRRNSYHTNLPPEVARLVQLRGALNRKINARARAADGAEQTPGARATPSKKAKR